MKIISIDPAFKRCGIVVLDGYVICGSDNLNFVGEKEAKQNQTDYTITLFRAIKAAVDRLISEHNPDLFLLENQIGKFACTQVHSLLVAAIDLAGRRVVSQSPKFKLQDHWGLVDYQPRDCNAYNQNKNKSKAVATHFCKESHQEIDLDRDISDALLQGIYFQKYVNKLPFDYASFKKDTLITELMVENIAKQSKAKQSRQKPGTKQPKKSKSSKIADVVEAVPSEVDVPEVVVPEVVVPEVHEEVQEEIPTKQVAQDEPTESQEPEIVKLKKTTKRQPKSKK